VMDHADHFFFLEGKGCKAKLPIHRKNPTICPTTLHVASQRKKSEVGFGHVIHSFT
jgi:hypothetical protein